MKKVLSTIVTISFLSLLIVPVMVSAQQPGPADAPTWGEVDVMETMASITDWLFAILLIVAAIFIIVAGYFFVTASGDPEKTKRARDFVMYALIGVLVGFVAKGLVILVDTIVRG